MAEYVGHKLHVDQNEKMVMFGVTHVMAIDGFCWNSLSLRIPDLIQFWLGLKEDDEAAR